MTVQQGQHLSIISTYAATRHMEKEALVATLMKTIAPNDATMEDLIGFLQIAHRFDLDPWAKEIFLIKNKGRVSTYVSVDGYARIVNREPQYDGCDFTYDQDDNGRIIACTCSMYRKDRARPTVVTEFYDECAMPNSEAWKRSPGRMLRHRAFVQAARLTFGISGALDEGSDFTPPTIEAGDITTPEPQRPTPRRRPPSPGEAKQEPEAKADEKAQPGEQQQEAQFDLQGLLDAMEAAKTTEELRAIYNDYDADSALQETPDDLDKAQNAFIKHSKRLGG